MTTSTPDHSTQSASRAARSADKVTGVMFKSRRSIPPSSAEGAHVVRDEAVPEAFELYMEWRRRSAACKSTYRRWATARSRDAALAFATYTAALDREEQAAAEYQNALCPG